MTKSKRLRPIAELADKDQKTAAKTMRASEQALEDYTARLGELETYRAQYLERFVTEGSGGLQAHELKDFRVFLANLDLAIEQIKEQIHAAQAQYRQHTDHWSSTHRRFRALDQAVTRFSGEERAQAAHAEQHRIDECAQRSGSQGAKISNDE